MLEKPLHSNTSRDSVFPSHQKEDMTCIFLSNIRHEVYDDRLHNLLKTSSSAISYHIYNCGNHKLHLSVFTRAL